MTKLLAISAVAEAGTGVALLVDPPMVVRLLFGAEIADAGIVVSRVAGIALIGLGIACWPSRDAGGAGSALRGMLAYSFLATLYLGYLGAARETIGALLWPAVAIHAVISALLFLDWSKIHTR